MIIFKFVYIRFFRNVANIILLCILPVAMIFLTGDSWIGLPTGFQYYGILQMIIAARLADIILEDRTKKITLRIGAAPITNLQYLWQNLLAYAVMLILQNIVVILIGSLLMGGDVLFSPWLLFVLYSCFSVTSIALALAWYSLFRRKDSAGMILITLILFMAMLGGLLWPLEIMPEFIQQAAMLLPTYWLAEGMRSIASVTTLNDLLLPLGVLLMFSAAFLLLGSRRRIS